MFVSSMTEADAARNKTESLSAQSIFSFKIISPNLG